MNTDKKKLLSEQQLEQWKTDGYVIVRGLWSAEEIAACRKWFDELGEKGEALGGHWQPEADSDVPLAFENNGYIDRTGHIILLRRDLFSHTAQCARTEVVGSLPVILFPQLAVLRDRGVRTVGLGGHQQKVLQ